MNAALAQRLYETWCRVTQQRVPPWHELWAIFYNAWLEVARAAVAPDATAPKLYFIWVNRVEFNQFPMWDELPQRHRDAWDAVLAEART